MKSRTVLAMLSFLAGMTLALNALVGAQQRGAGQRGGAQGDGQQQEFAQPPGTREYAVKEIPGVVAAGAKWTVAWQGTDNADGLVGTPDGGIVFAQEQPSTVGKLDKNDQFSILLRGTHGAGSLGIDRQGRIIAAERTCTDPGNAGRGITAPCTEPTKITILTPERKVLTDNINGKSFGRPNDVAISRNGVYFTSGGVYFVNWNGQTSSIDQDVRSNGIALNRTETVLYVTNGPVIMAYDIQADGTTRNRREFAKMEAGGNGDGGTIDSEGRLYISSNPGIQVFSEQGKFLGLIPTPRSVMSAAFSGPDKKTLYSHASGASLGPNGTEFRTPPGVRNNAKTILKISLIAQGFKDRPK
jgi:gluconolactonase